jgi:hypothetical protein
VLTIERKAVERNAPEKPFTVTYSFVEDGRTVNAFLADPESNLILQFDAFHKARTAAIEFIASPYCPDSAFVHINRSCSRFSYDTTYPEGFAEFAADLGPFDFLPPRMKKAAEAEGERKYGEQNFGHGDHIGRWAKATGAADLLALLSGARAATYRKPNARAAAAFERLMADIFDGLGGRGVRR